MADVDLTPIWSRIDQHGKALQEHEVNLKLAERRLDQHENDMRKMAKESVVQHTEVMLKIESLGTTISGDIKQLQEDYQQRQGAKVAKQESKLDYKMVATFVASACALVSVVYMVASK